MVAVVMVVAVVGVAVGRHGEELAAVYRVPRSQEGQSDRPIDRDRDRASGYGQAMRSTQQAPAARPDAPARPHPTSWITA